MGDLEVSAIDSFPSVTDGSHRSLSTVTRLTISLRRILLNEEELCGTLDRVHDVCRYLLDHAPVWLDEG